MSVTKRLSREEWSALDKAFSKSSETLRVFCLSHGINQHTFQYWRTKFRKETVSAKSFVQIKAKPEGSPGIVLRKGSVELCFPSSYPGTELAALLNDLSC